MRDKGWKMEETAGTVSETKQLFVNQKKKKYTTAKTGMHTLLPLFSMHGVAPTRPHPLLLPPSLRGVLQVPQIPEQAKDNLALMKK